MQCDYSPELPLALPSTGVCLSARDSHTHQCLYSCYSCLPGQAGSESGIGSHRQGHCGFMGKECVCVCVCGGGGGGGGGGAGRVSKLL